MTMPNNSKHIATRIRTNNDVQKLRKAAGSQSFELLQRTVMDGCWSAREIDEMNDNKNPTHMAAWKGCIDNLRFLVEELRCDINVISKGEFSYGKTPIFFALTQSREDIVDYLLENTNACVKIVNNKGQTPLSIASSHVSASLIRKIQAKEWEQASIEWVNYRKTHSDGLTYGDLDPRFLSDACSVEDKGSMVITEFAINPTTAQSRKGNFLRNNPQVAKEGVKNEQGTIKTRKRDRNSEAGKYSLTAEEMKELEVVWNRLIHGFCSKIHSENDWLLFLNLKTKQRQPWIEGTAKQLRQAVINDEVDAIVESFFFFVEELNRKCSENQKSNIILLQRLASQLTQPVSKPEKQYKPIRSRPERIRRNLLSNPMWDFVSGLIPDLSMSTLENDQSPFLTLPYPPIWVDSMEELTKLIDVVDTESVFAIDSEWQHDGIISTLQLASVSGSVWVIDLSVRSIDNDDSLLDHQFHKSCRKLIHTIFEEKILLGFAMGHDIPKINKYVFGFDNNESRLCSDKCLDLQERFWDGPCSRGLASCVSEFTTWKLSKVEQCSDWSQRPLLSSQLEYAALDAVILWFLFSEIVKKHSNIN